jgi:4'-phosphopantetheinyl transferase
LSRSSNATAVCLGWNTAVGVDVESLEQRVHMTPALLEYAFSPNERRALGNRHSREEDALKLWTRKEAILKADGRGLRLAPAQIETQLIDCRPTCLPVGLGALDDWGVYTRSSGTEVVSIAVRR